MLPTAVVFSAPKARTAPDGSTEHELTVSGSSSSLFQDWVKAQDDQHLCAYFRAVCAGLADRQLQHYHFKISNGRYNHRARAQDPKWHFAVFYGQQDAAADDSALRSGPLQVPRCMSCDLQCPLLLGITGEDPDSATAAAAAAAASGAQTTAAEAAPGGCRGSVSAAEASEEGPPDQHTLDPPQQQDAAQQQPQQPFQPAPYILRSQDSLVRDSEHCRVWFDAKGRPMFVVTPKQHLEQLTDLSDPQLVDLFRMAVAVFGEMGCGCISMVLKDNLEQGLQQDRGC